MLLKSKIILSSLSVKALNYSCKLLCSQLKNSLKPFLQQRAQMASDIIKMIDQDPRQPAIPIEQERLVPLAQKVEDFVQNTKKYDQEVKAQLQNLFINGTVLDKQVFNQTRIKKARNQTTKNYTYCPNSIITKQIFNAISGKLHPGRSYILKGYKGISKTWSTSFFWKLTQLIDSYRFSQGLQRSQIKKFDVPKVIYWSLSERNNFQQVKDIILRQCPQLQKYRNNKQFLKSGDQFSRFFYNRGIKVVLVIDDFNVLPLLYRQHMKLKQILKNKEKNGQILTDYQKFMLQYLSQRTAVLDDLVYSFSHQFDKVVYLSSMEIESSIPKTFKLAGDGTKQQVNIYEVNYSNIIYEKQNSYQIAHYYVFQLKRDILKQSNINLSRQILKQIQNQCALYLQEKKYQYFNTFLNIREAILEKQEALIKFFKKFDKQSNKIQLKTEPINFFKKIVYKSTQITKKQFLQRFQKHDQFHSQRNILALAIYQQAKKIIGQRQQNIEKQKQSSIKYQHILPSGLNLENLNTLKITKAQVQKLLDLNFFSVTNEKIVFCLPVQIIVSALEPKISQSLSYYIKNTNNWMGYINNTNTIGSMIQQLFILALKKGGVSFSFNTVKKKVIKQFQFDRIKEGAYRFRSLLSQKPQNKNLIKQLIPCFKQIINNNQKNVIFLPVNSQYFKEQLILDDVKTQQIIYNNPVIDLMIVKNLYQIANERKIQIYAIDVVIQKQDQTVLSKITKFLQYYQQFQDNQLVTFEEKIGKKQVKFKIQLKYFVFCEQYQQKQLLKYLKAKFQNKFKFTSPSHSNLINVKFTNKKKSVLKEIGFVNIAQNTQFKRLNASMMNDVVEFHQLCKLLKEKRKKK